VEPALEPELLHRFKNLLGVAVGYCDLLLDEIVEEDRKRSDVLEIRRTVQQALALVPELAERLKK
jgi:hypothetical protein